MLNSVKKIVKNAGSLLRQHYFEHGKMDQVGLKEDLSPITSADLASHSYLMEALDRITPFTIISEEIDFVKNPPYGSTFWLIDPLDGSKGFINGNKDFCINVALIQQEEPVLSIIYAPLYDELYSAEKDKGAYLEVGRKLVRLPEKSPPEPILLRSLHHDHALADEFLLKNHLTRQVKLGSAIKFGNIASGRASFYPRWTATREWDTAAGQLLITEAGGIVLDFNTGKAPSYNKPDFKNNPFIACAKGVSLESLDLPGARIWT